MSETLLGAHVSISGGVANALLEAQELKCNAIQIFTTNNRQWNLKSLKSGDVETFLELNESLSITVVCHASYLINLGSPHKLVTRHSVQALIAEFMRCSQLKIPCLILHSGSRLKSSESAALEQVAKLADEALEESDKSVFLAFENTAGQGSALGYTFEQLRDMRSAMKHKKRVGFCFDTCHAHAAGYQFTDKASCQQMWKEFDRIIGLEHLKAMHLNDSLRPCGSRIDRHEAIGKGTIGLEAFRYLMNDPRFFDIPKIIETPRETLADHKHNLQTLRKLIKKRS